MKKLLLPIIALAMLFVGCAKEVEEQAPTDRSTRTEATQQPIEFSNQTLSFASMAQLDAKVAELAELTYEDRQAWLDGQSGFVSMEAAASKVGEQMRICPDLDNVLALREAYADVFVFDPSTVVPVNAAPYYKVSKSGYEWVCNAYGDVEVGGQVLNLNDITSYAQTWRGKADNEAILARNPATRAINTLTLTDGGARSTITAIFMPSSGYRVSLKYVSEGIINSQWWAPREDKFTVSFTEDRTNLSSFDYYDGIYAFLTYPGSWATVTTVNGIIVEQILGTTSKNFVNSTCYTIESKNAYKSGDLVIVL